MSIVHTPNSAVIADVLLRDAAHYLREYFIAKEKKPDASALRYVECESIEDLTDQESPA